MSDYLTVRITHRQKSPIPWQVWSASEKELVASGELPGLEHLPELAEQADERDVTVLVPACEVILKAVAIPSGAARQLEPALPFLMEDDIAQDVEQLHFCLLNRQGDTAYVCAIERSWLEEILAAFKAHNMKVVRLLPDVLALPIPPEAELSAAKVGDEWLVRKGLYQGVSVEEAWLPLLADSPWSRADNELLSLNAYSPLPASCSALSEQWAYSETADISGMLAKEALTSPVNLLTGPYKPKSPVWKSWRIWRPVALAASVLLLVYCASAFLQIRQNESLAQEYRVQSKHIFERIFPGQSRIPTTSYLKRKMQDEEDRLFAHDAGSSPLVLMEELSSVFPAKGELTLQSLDYDSRRAELHIQVQSKAFKDLDTLHTTLDKSFVVDQGAVNRSGDHVSGSFTLKRKS